MTYDRGHSGDEPYGHGAFYRDVILRSLRNTLPFARHDRRGPRKRRAACEYYEEG